MNVVLPNAIEAPSGKGREGENFPVGSLLIRKDLREHIHALYNFARASDDISDHPLLEPDEKVRRLDHFAAIIKGEVDDNVPSATAMRESLRSTGITPQHCLDLLTAFKRDATQLRYKDWEDLLDYCRYSAAPVGRHVLTLHGVGERAWPASDALCSALQIINHMQDCADDYAALDRVYLPLDMLEAEGARVEALAAKSSSPQLRATLNAMTVKLEAMMPLGRQIPRLIPDVRLKCETAIIWVLAVKLIALLKKRDPLAQPTKLGKAATASAAISGLLRAWF